MRYHDILKFLKMCVVYINVLFISTPVVFAQTAALLPNARQQYFDGQGNVLAGGSVGYYVPGGTTLKPIWLDSGETIPAQNPVTLDESGYPEQTGQTYGDGSYRQIVKDVNGVTIWDNQTASTGSGGGGGGSATVGDGDAVGTLKAWSGLTPPYGYVFAFGQGLIRATYPELFSAITSQQDVSCVSGSAVLTGLIDTSQFGAGTPVESTCLNPGTTVVSTTVSTVTVSSVAIISTTATARFFPFGNGDGSVTFNVPDYRGRVPAGRDNMGGIAANRLTSTYFGTSADALAANGGSQSQTLTTTNLPPYTPAGTVSGTFSGTGTATTGQVLNASSGTAVVPTYSGGVVGFNTMAVTIPSQNITATFAGTAQGGTSSPVTTIQPTQTTNYIIKAIPDSNPNTFFGVASIGGMYGIITCGTGLTCAGNSISATSSLLDLTVGLTPVSNGTSNALLFDNGGILGNVITGSNSVLTADGSGVPSFQSSNAITNTLLSNAPATTIKGNPTAGSTSPQDFTIQGLPNLSSPSSTLDYIPIYDHTSGTIKNVTPGAIASAGVLPSIANGAVLANTSGSTAVPVGTTATSWFDTAFCNTVGYLVARTTGGWVCSRGSPVNVVWFGADPTGTNDSLAAFNAAITSGACSSVCQLWVPNGTYNLSGVLTIPTGVQLHGETRRGTILRGTAANQDIIDITSGGDQTVSNISMIYSSAQSGSSAIYVTNHHNVTIRDVVIYQNQYYGIRIGTGANGYITNIEDVEIDTGYSGIYLTDNAANVKVINAEISSTSFAGVYIESSGGAQFINVNTLQCGYGMTIGPGSGESVKGIQVLNSFLDTSTNENLRIAPNSGGTISSTVFTNLWSSSSQTSVGVRVGLTGGGTVQGITFNAPIIIGNAQHGIIMQNTSSINITGAQITGNSTSSIGAYDGIYSDLNATNISITGSRSGPSASFSGGGQNCGLRFAGSTSANNLIATNNVLDGNVTSLCIGTAGSQVYTSPNVL